MNSSSFPLQKHNSLHYPFNQSWESTPEKGITTNQNSLNYEKEVYELFEWNKSLTSESFDNKKIVIQNYFKSQNIEDPYKGFALAFQICINSQMNDSEAFELIKAVDAFFSNKKIRLNSFDYFSQVRHLILNIQVPFKVIQAITMLAGFYHIHSNYSFSRKYSPASFWMFNEGDHLRIKGVFCNDENEQFILFPLNPEEACEILSEALADQKSFKKIASLKPLYEMFAPIDPIDFHSPANTADYLKKKGYHHSKLVEHSYKLLNTKHSFIACFGLHIVALAHTQNSKSPDVEAIKMALCQNLRKEGMIVVRQMIIKNIGTLLKDKKLELQFMDELLEKTTDKDSNKDEINSVLIKLLLTKPCSERSLSLALEIFNHHIKNCANSNPIRDEFVDQGLELGLSCIEKNKTKTAIGVLQSLQKLGSSNSLKKLELLTRICNSCLTYKFATHMMSYYSDLGEIAIQLIINTPFKKKSLIIDSPAVGLPPELRNLSSSLSYLIRMQLQSNQITTAQELLTIAIEKELLTRESPGIKDLTLETCEKMIQQGHLSPIHCYRIWKYIVKNGCWATSLNHQLFTLELAKSLDQLQGYESARMLKKCLVCIEQANLGPDIKDELNSLWIKNSATLLKTEESKEVYDELATHVKINRSEEIEFYKKAFFHELERTHYNHAWDNLSNLKDLFSVYTMTDQLTHMSLQLSEAIENDIHVHEQGFLLYEVIKSKSFQSLANTDVDKYLDISLRYIEKRISMPEKNCPSYELERFLENLFEVLYSKNKTLSDASFQRIAQTYLLIANRPRTQLNKMDMSFELGRWFPIILERLKKLNRPELALKFIESLIGVISINSWKKYRPDSLLWALNCTLQLDNLSEKEISPAANLINFLNDTYKIQSKMKFQKELIHAYCTLSKWYFSKNDSENGVIFSGKLCDMRGEKAITPKTYDDIVFCANACIEQTNEYNLAVKLNNLLFSLPSRITSHHINFLFNLLSILQINRNYTLCLMILSKNAKFIKQSENNDQILEIVNNTLESITVDKLQDFSCLELLNTLNQYDLYTAKYWKNAILYAANSKSNELKSDVCKLWMEKEVENRFEHLTSEFRLACWQQCIKMLTQLQTPELLSVIIKIDYIQSLAENENKTHTAILEQINQNLLLGCLALFQHQEPPQYTEKQLHQLIDLKNKVPYSSNAVERNAQFANIDLPLIMLLVKKEKIELLLKACRMLHFVSSHRASISLHNKCSLLFLSLLNQELKRDIKTNEDFHSELISLSELIRTSGGVFREAFECSNLVLKLPHKDAVSESAHLLIHGINNYINTDNTGNSKGKLERAKVCLQAMKALSAKCFKEDQFLLVKKCLEEPKTKTIIPNNEVQKLHKILISNSLNYSLESPKWSNEGKSDLLKYINTHWLLQNKHSTEFSKIFFKFFDLLIDYLASTNNSDDYSAILNDAFSFLFKKHKSQAKGKTKNDLHSEDPESSNVVLPIIMGVTGKMFEAIYTKKVTDTNQISSLYSYGKYLIEYSLTTDLTIPTELIFDSFQKFCVSIPFWCPDITIEHNYAILGDFLLLCASKPKQTKALSTTLKIITGTTLGIVSLEKIDIANKIKVIKKLCDFFEIIFTEKFTSKEIILDIISNLVIFLPQLQSAVYDSCKMKILQMLDSALKNNYFRNNSIEYFQYKIFVSGKFPNDNTLNASQKNEIIHFCITEWVKIGSDEFVKKAISYLSSYKKLLNKEIFIQCYSMLLSKIFDDINPYKQSLLFSYFIHSNLPLNDLIRNNNTTPARSLLMHTASCLKNLEIKLSAEQKKPSPLLKSLADSYLMLFEDRRAIMEIFQGRQAELLIILCDLLDYADLFDYSDYGPNPSNTIIQKFKMYFSGNFESKELQLRCANRIKIWFLQKATLSEGAFIPSLKVLLNSFLIETSIFQNLDKDVEEMKRSL